MSCPTCKGALDYAAKLNIENDHYMDFFEKVIHAEGQLQWGLINEAINELFTVLEQEDLEEENAAELSDEPESSEVSGQ